MSKGKKMQNYELDFKLKVLKEAEEVGNFSLVAERYKLPKSTLFTWKKSLENKAATTELNSVKDLKKKLADKELENEVLKELLKKTYQVWSKE